MLTLSCTAPSLPLRSNLNLSRLSIAPPNWLSLTATTVIAPVDLITELFDVKREVDNCTGVQVFSASNVPLTSKSFGPVESVIVLTYRTYTRSSPTLSPPSFNSVESSSAMVSSPLVKYQFCAP